MWRTILSHSLWTIIVSLVMLFAGPMIFGLYEKDSPIEMPCAKVIAGVKCYKPLGYVIDVPFFWLDGTASDKTKHFTIVFHVFMLLHIFNFYNCRKLLPKEFNILSGFFNNFVFHLMVIVVVLIQLAMVNADIEIGTGKDGKGTRFGALPARICRTTALSMNENLICVAIGATSLLIQAIVRATPEELLQKINITLINEDKVVSDDDPIMSALKGDSGAHKSSTARLLEEWK